MKILFIFLLCYLIYYFKFVLRVNIDYKSFFRKGFKKIQNEYGLFCYTGKQGSGKTYSAVKFCIDRKLATNAVIITNVTSFNLFSDTVFITDIQELMNYVINLIDNQESVFEAPNIIIFFDEIFTILEKNTRINKDILSFISQLRKRGIIFVTTAQEWLEINITFRRYVRYQCDTRMISFLNNAIIINEINDGEQLKWDKDLNEYVAPRISTKISKGNLSIVESYDTYETIKVSNNTSNR